MSRKLPKVTTQTMAEVRDAPRSETNTSAPRGEAPGAEAIFPSDRAELRHLEAQAIVHRHTTMSAIGGLVPIPLADTVSLMVIVGRMVHALAQHYGAPIGPERGRAIAAAVVGGIAPPVLTSTVVGGLSRLIPGVALFGAAVSSTAAAGLTRTLGQAFILHFEAGGTAQDFDVESIRQRSPATA